MNRRTEHFFGDMLRRTNEDEYIDLPIIPAKPRSNRHITDNKVAIAKHELKSVIEEFKR